MGNQWVLLRVLETYRGMRLLIQYILLQFGKGGMSKKVSPISIATVPLVDVI